MSKIAVIYAGKYGTTQRYAGWIAEEIGADLFEAEKCRAADVMDYDTIVFGGAIHAGGILGIKFLKKNFSKLSGKRIFTFAVGLNVSSSQAQEECREINFVKKLAELPCWFLPGAYDPEKVTGFDKKLMGVVKKMITGKKAEEMTEDERKLLDAIENGASYVNREAIADLVQAVKFQEH